MQNQDIAYVHSSLISRLVGRESVQYVASYDIGSSRASRPPDIFDAQNTSGSIRLRKHLLERIIGAFKEEFSVRFAMSTVEEVHVIRN